MTAATLPMTPEARNRARFLDFLRVFAGLALLGVLAYLLWTPGMWTTKLMAWVLVTLLADELGGWFGYIGLGLGVLGLLAPETPLQQWLVIFPLIGGALMALLLVKHSGGAFVLPFGALLFAAVVLGVGRYGAKIDPTLKLPANESFQLAAILPMLAGVAFSFVRQLVQTFVRYQARRASAAPATERVVTAVPGETETGKVGEVETPLVAPALADKEAAPETVVIEAAPAPQVPTEVQARPSLSKKTD